MRGDQISYGVVSTHSRPKAAGTIHPSDDVAPNSFNTQPPEGGWPPTARFRAYARPFQHTAARRRLAIFFDAYQDHLLFQHTAARRRLVFAHNDVTALHFLFQHTAARRRLGSLETHKNQSRRSFNTQPPEGGWDINIPNIKRMFQFQHTAARRRLATTGVIPLFLSGFQHTAARRRLGRSMFFRYPLPRFNTQPPEGGWFVFGLPMMSAIDVSTHSRPKAAGC